MFNDQPGVPVSPLLYGPTLSEEDSCSSRRSRTALSPIQRDHAYFSRTTHTHSCFHSLETCIGFHTPTHTCLPQGSHSCSENHLLRPQLCADNHLLRLRCRHCLARAPQPHNVVKMNLNLFFLLTGSSQAPAMKFRGTCYAVYCHLHTHNLLYGRMCGLLTMFERGHCAQRSQRSIVKLKRSFLTAVLPLTGDSKELCPTTSPRCTPNLTCQNIRYGCFVEKFLLVLNTIR